ncbi:hypothetical protein ACGC1H_004193 [Rhizoctonia solani]|uniref:Uncharacterized protein n=1 Tax=Rhizoctonia solani TaxID=456999 RepID=A0A8H3BX38_9AGAM|nr:unnamed protein product [Rhizoctonia solani]
MHTHPSNRPRNLTCLIFAGFAALLTTAVFLVEYSSIETKHALCATVLPDTTLTRATYVLNDTAPRARTLDARTLISAVATGQQVSARFIHQSWKTHELKPSTVPLADSWRLAYPDWDYVLWDDADNKELVRVLYPRLLGAYEALPREIYRADFVRNLYMHAFGGIYSDLDSEAVAPLDPLLSASAERLSDSTSTPVAFVGQMVTSENLAHAVPNAFFAATSPGHPFWFVPIEFAVAWVSDWTAHRTEGEEPVDPEFVTGPVALRYSLFVYADPVNWPASDASHVVRVTNSAPLPPLADLPSRIAPNDTAPPVALLPPDIIYPYSWDTPRPQLGSAATKCVCWMNWKTYDREKCKSRVGARWVVNYWSHGW